MHKIDRNNKIILIGMPGSGKSTIGRLLAERFEYKWIDTDQFIENKIQKTINQIFDDKNLGEEYFRKLETELLINLLSDNHSYIISTGGGLPCYNDNMEIIKKKAICIYLDLPLEIISKRIVRDENRPMFKGLTESEITSKIQSLNANRHPKYSQANLTINNDDINQITTIIEKFLNSLNPKC